MKSVDVYKFGGVAVGSAEALRIAAGHVRVAASASAAGARSGHRYTLVVVVSAMSGIYRTALYHYAANGTVPGEFSGIDFGAAFRRRNDRGNRGGIFGSPSSN